MGRAQGKSDRLRARLRDYLGALAEYEQQGMREVSSHQLARKTAVRASLVRRDLASLGTFGTPGRGYETARLGEGLRQALELAKARTAIWVGVSGAVDWGRVSRSLLAASCSLAGVFDDAAAGRAADSLTVQPLSRAPAETRRTGATIVVVGSEHGARAELLERLVAAGVEGIVNLTPLRLDIPSRVVVEQCDLGSEVVRLVSRLGG
ncbi:MAG: winged-helix domain-containing protein [Armatimonadota bacterium]